MAPERLDRARVGARLAHENSKSHKKTYVGPVRTKRWCKKGAIFDFIFTLVPGKKEKELAPQAPVDNAMKASSGVSLSTERREVSLQS